MTSDLPPHRLVVGLEVHVQLRAHRKLFSDCAARRGETPNTFVGPQCLGLPGSLPVLDAQALDLALRAGIALGCEIQERSSFARKAYSYPDLPKGYQITQFDEPLLRGGAVEFDGSTGPRTLRIRSAHLEEDSARLVHRQDGSVLVDYERAGIALLEIVTEPELHDVDDVVSFLAELRRILRHAGASACDMERGEMRCEPNVNVHVLRDRNWVASRIVEIKNLNSLKACAAAIEFERGRQIDELLAGGAPGPRPASTRGWDDAHGVTVPQRAKEGAADYRFMPEPDLPPISAARQRADELRPSLPDLPRRRRRRYVGEFGLALADADALLDSRELADWFDGVVTRCGDGRAAANWVLNDVLREAHARNVEPWDLPLQPEVLGDLVLAVATESVATGSVTGHAARKLVLPRLCDTGGTLTDALSELDLTPPSPVELLHLVQAVLADNAELVDTARQGREEVLEVLLGEVLRRSGGTADALAVRAALREQVLGE